jgi:hypothetical protein
MIKKLLIPLLLFTFSFADAATIKTDVLVVGGGASGLAAAIQCARSKVKTLLVEPGPWLGGSMTASGMAVIDANRNLPSGIWGEFRRKVTDYYRTQPGYDTTYNAALQFEPYIGASILKKITDTVKNLTVKLNTPWISIKKNGIGWEVNIKVNGETVTVKAEVVIDATQTGGLVTKAGARFPAAFDNFKDNSELKTYRTSIAAGEALPGQQDNDTNAPSNNYPPYPAYCIPINAVILNDADNLLVTEKILPGSKTIQYLPFQLTLGQGVGTVAAYCAFFKTTTKHLTVRIIQGELLDFKGYLLPFTDIPQKEGPHFRAIQQVSAAGLLKGIRKVNGNAAEIHFEPNAIVSTEEIKPVLTEFYTRAFLWFNNEKPGDKFTLGNLLSLISDYTLTDPKTLHIYLKKAWTTQFKLTGDFDMNRPVTRLEFAVLVNKYLNPFAKTVDLSGRIVN